MEKAETKGAAFDFYGKLPLTKAVPLGLQHVLAMFVGNLTPILIITGACGIGAGSEFAELQVDLLQNAMLVAGIVTLVQLYAIGPVGGKVPIIMGTSSGFIGVFNSVAKVMGGGPGHRSWSPDPVRRDGLVPIPSLLAVRDPA